PDMAAACSISCRILSRAMAIRSSISESDSELPVAMISLRVHCKTLDYRVMAGLVLAIPLMKAQWVPKRDARHKAGHDVENRRSYNALLLSFTASAST